MDLDEVGNVDLDRVAVRTDPIRCSLVESDLQEVSARRASPRQVETRTVNARQVSAGGSLRRRAVRPAEPRPVGRAFECITA